MTDSYKNGTFFGWNDTIRYVPEPASADIVATLHVRGVACRIDVLPTNLLLLIEAAAASGLGVTAQSNWRRATQLAPRNRDEGVQTNAYYALNDMG